MKKLLIMTCFVLIGISCTKIPTDISSLERQPEQDANFDFCVGALYYFSIFQSALPKNPYAYNTIRELYATVQDPWTTYYTKDTASLFMQMLTTSTVGIGVWVDSVQSGILIRQVFSNSPAERAGVKAMDTIVTINGNDLAGLTMDDRLALLHGTPGQTKQLTINRAGQQVQITVMVASYLAPSVYSDSLDSVTAYIALSIFTDESAVPGGSAVEFRQALEKTAWATYTIFDLRHNGGGLVDQCIDIAGEFVPAGTQIVASTERYLDTIVDTVGTRNSVWSTTRTDGLALNMNRKFILLTDRFSASASELLTTCLRDYRPDIKRIGDTTYGKARAQYMWYPTPRFGLAKVTYSLMTPVKGAAYDLVGIPPDIATTSDNALAAARERISQGGLGRRLSKNSADAQTLDRITRLRQQFLPAHWEALGISRRN